MFCVKYFFIPALVSVEPPYTQLWQTIDYIYSQVNRSKWLSTITETNNVKITSP